MTHGFPHVAVRMRGGPLDGQEWHFSPLEYGHEIRVTGIAQEGNRVIIRELFYVPVGYVNFDGIADGYTPILVADYAATQDTELPRVA